MKRGQSKKSTERRKKPRHKPSATGRKSGAEHCQHCSEDLRAKDRALFVEEEVGRIFCSEACIASYFTPDIERLEKEFFRRLSPSDLTGEERDKLAHLRWITLQEPDEVWREKTLSGDHRFTLISEFQPGNKKVWCVCICLFLRGEPSFLYLAFPTRNAAMVNTYRKGERIEWSKSERGDASATLDQAMADAEAKNGGGEAGQEAPLMDGLADAWTEDETLRAQLAHERSEDDISPDEFSLYQTCLEETLETPDEVWSLEVGHGESTTRLYHFIRHYPDEKPGVWYVIIAREIEDEEQIEILDAFPTKDSGLVDRYRRGTQEVGNEESRPVTRMVH